MRGLLFSLVLLAGCGASAPDVARRAVTAADEIQIAGMKSFVDFDLMHQTAIVESDRSIEDKRTDIADYRKTRARLVAAFQALAAASHGAKATIDLYEAGKVNSVDWGALVQAVISSGQALRDAAGALGVKVPGLDALLAPISRAPREVLRLARAVLDSDGFAVRGCASCLCLAEGGAR